MLNDIWVVIFFLNCNFLKIGKDKTALTLTGTIGEESDKAKGYYGLLFNEESGVNLDPPAETGGKWTSTETFTRSMSGGGSRRTRARKQKRKLRKSRRK